MAAELSHEALTAALTQLRAQAEAARKASGSSSPWVVLHDTAREHVRPITNAAATCIGETWEPRWNAPLAEHIATWHPGMALAVIAAAVETLREHRSSLRESPGYVLVLPEGMYPRCIGCRHQAWPCPPVLRIASWAMPKEGQ